MSRHSRLAAAAAAALLAFGGSAGPAALAVGLAGAPAPARADASAALKGVLTTLKGLSDRQFREVMDWARNNGNPPNNAYNPVQSAEIQIGSLSYRDGQAVLSWLRGNGRSALYAQGASDWDIGPRRPADISNPTPAPTPNPYRELQLTTPTLGPAASPGNIAVLGGFAAASRDGKTAMACVSFQNNAPVAATRVVIDFTLLDGNGNTVGTLHLDRSGTFSTGVGIMTYPTFDQWGGGNGLNNRDYAKNCATVTSGVAAMPILQARYATYAITHVEYANGTTWPAH